MITALPLYHIFAFTANLMVFFVFGGRNILHSESAAAHQPEPGADHRGRHLAHRRQHALRRADARGRGSSSHTGFTLKGTVAGGMALVPAVGERWEAMTKTPMYQGYGLTETSPVVSLGAVPPQQARVDRRAGARHRRPHRRRRRARRGAGEAGRAARARPAGDARLLAAARRDRARAQGRLARHRRHRHRRRRRLPLHRRPQEGHDPRERLQRLSQRGRGGDRRASRRGGSGGDRHARRDLRRGRVRLRRPQGPGAHRGRCCATTAASR